MPNYVLSDFLTNSKIQQILMLEPLNAQLEKMTALARVRWAMEHLQGPFVLSSSFGIQAAVMLHLLVSERSDIPVILIDTGYLFPETYQFIELLSSQLALNLQIYRAKQSPAWQETQFGKLWEQGIKGIERYNQINKVEPMKRALVELNAKTWFSGLRREQSDSRQTLPVLSIQHGVFKFLPLIDWTNKDIHSYLKENKLPYHPLWEKGYVSVGDVHTTQKLDENMREEDTRFFGLKRECGLHEDDVNDGAGI